MSCNCKQFQLILILILQLILCCASQGTLLLHMHFNANNTLGFFNPLNAELNPICHLLALLGAHHILHVSRIRVNVYGT